MTFTQCFKGGQIVRRGQMQECEGIQRTVNELGHQGIRAVHNQFVKLQRNALATALLFVGTHTDRNRFQSNAQINGHFLRANGEIARMNVGQRNKREVNWQHIKHAKLGSKRTINT